MRRILFIAIALSATAAVITSLRFVILHRRNNVLKTVLIAEPLTRLTERGFISHNCGLFQVLLGCRLGTKLPSINCQVSIQNEQSTVVDFKVPVEPAMKCNWLGPRGLDGYIVSMPTSQRHIDLAGVLQTGRRYRIVIRTDREAGEDSSLWIAYTGEVAMEDVSTNSSQNVGYDGK